MTKAEEDDRRDEKNGRMQQVGAEVVEPFPRQRWREQHERDDQELALPADRHHGGHHHQRQQQGLDQITIRQVLDEGRGYKQESQRHQ